MGMEDRLRGPLALLASPASRFLPLLFSQGWSFGRRAQRWLGLGDLVEVGEQGRVSAQMLEGVVGSRGVEEACPALGTFFFFFYRPSSNW